MVPNGCSAWSWWMFPAFDGGFSSHDSYIFKVNFGENLTQYIVGIEQSKLSAWKRKSQNWKFLELVWTHSLVQPIENHCFLSSEVHLVMWSPSYLKLSSFVMTQALKQSMDTNPHRVWGTYCSALCFTRHVHWHKDVEMKQNQKDKYIELLWHKVVWEHCRRTA